MRFLYIILILILLVEISEAYKLVDKRIYEEKVTGLYKFKDYIFLIKNNREIDVYKLEYNFLDKLYSIIGRSKIDSLIGFESYRDYLIFSDKDYLLFVRLYSIRKDAILYKDWEKSPPETLYVATYSKNYNDADILLRADFGENKKYDNLVVIRNNYKANSSEIFVLKLGDGFFREIWNKSFNGIIRCATVFDYNEDSFDNFLAICLNNNVLIINKDGDVVDKIKIKADNIYKADFDNDLFYDDLIVSYKNELYKVENENRVFSVEKGLELNGRIRGILGVFSSKELLYYIIYTKNNIYRISNDFKILGKFYINKNIRYLINVDSDKDGIEDDILLVADNSLLLFKKFIVEIPEISVKYNITVEDNVTKVKYNIRNLKPADAYDLRIYLTFNNKTYEKRYKILEGYDERYGYKEFPGNEGLFELLIKYKDINQIEYEKRFEEKIYKIFDVNLSYKKGILEVNVIRKKKFNVYELLLKIRLENLRFSDGSLVKTFKGFKVKNYQKFKFKILGNRGRIYTILIYRYGNVSYKLERLLEVEFKGSVSKKVSKRIGIIVKKFLKKKTVSYGERISVYINVATNITGVKGFIKVKIMDKLPEGFEFVKGNGTYTLMLLPKDNYTYEYEVKVKNKFFSLGEKVIIPNATVIYNGMKFYSNSVELYIKPKIFPGILIFTIPIGLSIYLLVKRRERMKINRLRNLIMMYRRRGIKPSIREIAERLNMSEDEVRKLLRKVRR